jgi:hypothetical protein
MVQIQAGIIGIEVSQAAGQNWAIAIFDVTSGSPVQITNLPGMVNGVLPMVNFSGDSYYAEFTGAPNHRYAVNKAAYTDVTYTVVDVSQPQASEYVSVIPQIVIPGGSSALGVAIAGLVTQRPILGLVEDP